MASIIYTPLPSYFTVQENAWPFLLSKPEVISGQRPFDRRMSADHTMI